MFNQHHSDETKRKIRLGNKGKVISEEVRKKVSAFMKGRFVGVKSPSYGKIPWNKGKHGVYSESTIKKLSESHIGQLAWNKGKKGLKHSENAKQKISKSLKGIQRSEETRKKMSLAHKGDKGSNWKGGITSIRGQIVNSFQYKQWRQRVFIKDDFTCQECGLRGGELNAHHKNKTFFQLLEEVKLNLPLFPLYEAVMIYSPFWDVDNGETVHEKCHKQLHKKH